MHDPGCHDPQHRRGPAPPAGLDQEAFARRLRAAAPVALDHRRRGAGDRGKAEDVLQEAAVIALAKLDRFDPATSFPAWMGAIVRNVARNQARKDRRQATTPFPPELLADRCDADAARAPRPGAEGREPAAARLPVDARGELLSDSGAFDDALVAALRCARGAPALLCARQGLDYRRSRSCSRPARRPMGVHRAREACGGASPQTERPALAPAAQRGGAA
jgi:DNA-directed RNA polymerase specialized sigma24 family protein